MASELLSSLKVYLTQFIANMLQHVPKFRGEGTQSNSCWIFRGSFIDSVDCSMSQFGFEVPFTVEVTNEGNRFNVKSLKWFFYSSVTGIPQITSKQKVETQKSPKIEMDGTIEFSYH